MRRHLLHTHGALLLVVALLILGSGDAGAQAAPLHLTMAVTENREPGLAGEATITALGANQMVIAIRVTGLPPRQTGRAAHIHGAAGARCDSNALVIYPLETLVVDGAGVGTSTTTVTLLPDKPVLANNAYINVHSPTQDGRGVICANIPVSFVAGGALSLAGGQPSTPAPMTGPRTGTGGVPPDGGWLGLAIGTGVLGALVAGTLVLALGRRITR